MRFPSNRVLSLVLRHLAALFLVGAVTILLLPLSGLFGLQVIALIYLIPVLVATYFLGLTPGILTGFASFMMFNFFFIPPYHTLAVHQAQDLITLAVFLIVGVIISQLIGQAREGMRLARQHEWEATCLYRLMLVLAGSQDNDEISTLLVNHLQQTFSFERVEVFIGNNSNDGQAGNTTSSRGETKKDASISIPMETPRSLEGEVRVWMERDTFSPEETRLMKAIASQGALAIERSRLTQSATKARILEETDRAKSSLLSSVSHELRTPLAAIKASASSLRSGVVDWESEARSDLLLTIEEETDHLNFLVGNLLDMSRIEAGALKPQFGWNSLNEIVHGVLKRMHTALKDIRIQTALSEDLPLVPCDYVLLEQVFSNLINNSLKFSPSDSVIMISADVKEEDLQIEVSNESPAVPEQNLERIFDKFTQVRAKDRITGTGLGLSICKGIIEAHGGRIWASNASGRFIFHFTLPLLKDGMTAPKPQEKIHE